MLIAVFITEMVILHKYVFIIIIIIGQLYRLLQPGQAPASKVLMPHGLPAPVGA